MPNLLKSNLHKTQKNWDIIKFSCALFMDLDRFRAMTKQLALLLLVLPSLAGTASAATSIVRDNFNNSNLATVGAGDLGSGHQVLNNGTKTVTETTVARFVPGTTTDQWIRTEVHSNDEVPVSTLLTTNSSVTFSWTISNISTVRSAGADPEYRIQLGVLPASVAQGTGAEMYLNTGGGIWLDMNILGTNTVGADVQLYDANVGKTVNGDGVQRTTLADPTGWNWKTTPRTFTLTMTGTGYNWSDSAGTNYGGSTYAASGFAAPLLSQSLWGFHMGQDRADQGKGGHDLTNYSVVAIPETSPVILAAIPAGLCLLARRRKGLPVSA